MVRLRQSLLKNLCTYLTIQEFAKESICNQGIVYFSLAALLCLGSVYICKRKFSCSGKEIKE